MTSTSSTKPMTTTDPRVLFERGVATGTEVIGAVRPDQLTDVTPCGDMDVRHLLEHLVFVLDRVAALGRGEDPFAIGMPAAAESTPDDGWKDAWLAAAQEARTAWADDAVLDRIMVLPWSQVSGAETLLGYLNEITVHTWDVASATGQRPAWDDQVVHAAFGAIQTTLPAGNRAEVFAQARASMPPEFASMADPFAEAIPVADDARPIDKLVAWNGRDPEAAQP